MGRLAGARGYHLDCRQWHRHLRHAPSPRQSQGPSQTHCRERRDERRKLFCAAVDALVSAAERPANRSGDDDDDDDDRRARPTA